MQFQDTKIVLMAIAPHRAFTLYLFLIDQIEMLNQKRMPLQSLLQMGNFKLIEIKKMRI